VSRSGDNVCHTHRSGMGPRPDAAHASSRTGQPICSRVRVVGLGSTLAAALRSKCGRRVAPTSPPLRFRSFAARRTACALDVRALVGWRTRGGSVSGVQERRRRLGRLRRTRSTPCMLYLELSAATLEQLVVAQFPRRLVCGRWLRFRSNGAPAGADGHGFRMSAFGHGDESPTGA